MKFRKRPIEVDAWQWNGSLDGAPDWLSEAFAQDVAYFFNRWPIRLVSEGYDDDVEPVERELMIRTLEGPMRASLGDWIIRGVIGELYPIKPLAFERTFEAVMTATLDGDSFMFKAPD